MKIALIGQDVPMLFASMLADLLYAGKAEAEIALEERNYAMRDLLQRYGDAVIAQSGIPASLQVSESRQDVLTGADCVLYAGDYMAASRFQQDRDALSGEEEDDPLGLQDQARVNGGMGGLMHTLRQGEQVYDLCDDMRTYCPDAMVITLGQPVARTALMFERRSFRAFGLGKSLLRGAGGLDALCQQTGIDPRSADAEVCGLPGFAFVLSLMDRSNGYDATRKLRDLSQEGTLGRLNRRWLDWYGAVAVGDAADHAELLPAEPDFIPETHPAFGESVERRKERILWMNQASETGTPEASMAQMLLLSKAPAIRPMQLALALLRREDLVMPGVTRRNNGELPQLPDDAMIESRLTLQGGEIVPHGWQMPEALAAIMRTLDETNQLAAQAAAGDRSALRACIEIDPAMDGLDRLYLQDVADRLIRMHEDILTRL